MNSKDMPQPQNNLSAWLDGMYPALNQRYAGENFVARRLEAKLLKRCYSNIPEIDIEAPTSDEEKRAIFSAAMRENVEQKIIKARSNSPIDAYLSASEMLNTMNGVSTFGSWSGFRGRLLGFDVCQEIGQKVIEETGFSQKEAETIMKKHRKAYEKYINGK